MRYFLFLTITFLIGALPLASRGHAILPIDDTTETPKDDHQQTQHYAVSMFPFLQEDLTSTDTANTTEGNGASHGEEDMLQSGQTSPEEWTEQCLRTDFNRKCLCTELLCPGMRN